MCMDGDRLECRESTGVAISADHYFRMSKALAEIGRSLAELQRRRPSDVWVELERLERLATEAELF